MSKTAALSTLTVGETANILRVSRTKAYELVASGYIPTIRVGRSIRVPEHRLRSFLDGELRDEKTS
jgi:excisionase family DNA binding protein